MLGHVPNLGNRYSFLKNFITENTEKKELFSVFSVSSVKLTKIGTRPNAGMPCQFDAVKIFCFLALMVVM